jgi:hypothetical protein
LKEPTIKQGVFGSITLPVDDPLPADDTEYTEDGTIPSNNQSGDETVPTEEDDVYPVIRDIYFYPYTLIDSVRTFGPVDCYFPADFLPMKPVAIVRSNSDGYFQVPLDVGEYLYLVKEGNHYYMDAYISSHLPGFVKVYPEEVTRLLIHLIDCTMWMQPDPVLQ